MKDRCWDTCINYKRSTHTHTFQTGADEGGREVVIVVHQADVSRSEADCQQRFLAVHWEETHKYNTHTHYKQAIREQQNEVCNSLKYTV